ncbi:beta-N-acetylglucosaminidase domain-containing protein [Kitasatospora sp. MAP5-34]|uniref:beta-N-acetylglucosaminidase domain-containing protein n=1 Tax=Kitasatospora sp. MAP5-34 TaxID=3035102 RepID=UPI0024738470|nr:beta-N-acetylglucosaminidase domain-containing protein [Kitasatospora sp. MAP5-34]MDH6578285.1 hyaluronoglucosaminidase [Kitasatospora sp. MAP5-34]
MQARVSIVAGRRLRQQIEQSRSLREVLQHPAALAARRATARTARQLAPRAADRLIADLKGTEPLLASVRAERRATARPGRRRTALQVAATLSAAAVVGGLLVSSPGYAAPDFERVAATGSATDSAAPQTPLGSLTNPQIYPRPQSLTNTGRPVGVPKSVGLVLADKTDGPAVDAVRDVLHTAGATDVSTLLQQSQTPMPGSLVVYVGGPGEGADGTTDRVLRELTVAAGGTDTSGPSYTGLPAGGYLLAAGQLPTVGGSYGAIVLAGADPTGTFYAAQSLRQLLAPVAAGQGQGDSAAGRGFPGVSVRDWPSGAPVRGTAESFYGTPWTTEQRLDQLDFLGRSKQNYFLYAPGGDPYRLSRWRDAYPAAQADDLRGLGDRARANHVTLAYSVDPGQSFCYSSAKDVDALVGKLEAMRAVGFSAFQLQFLDVSYTEWHCNVDQKNFGTGPAAAARAQAALVTKVRDRLAAGHPELAPLSVVPTEYQHSGASPYRTALAAALPSGVQVAWSGGAVIPAKITGGQTADAGSLFHHPLMTLDNYPVNDSTPDRLYLGAYTGRDPEVASRSAVLLTAAMSQPIASRIPLATAADFDWNPVGYRPADSLRAALRPLADSDAALAALTALAGNSSSSPLTTGESGYLTPLLNRFWATLEPADGNTPDLARLSAAAAPVRDAFTVMAGAQQALGQDAVGTETAPWLAQLSTYGRAGQAAVDMLLAQRGGNGSAAWQARVQLRQLRDQLAQAATTVGAGVLDPFLEHALQSADVWSGVRTSAVTPTTTLGSAHDHTPSLMTDGDTDTFYWSYNPPQSGDSVGLDLGSGKPLGTVTVLMGSWGDGPDAGTAADDYLHDGVLEYTTGTGGWQQLAKVHNQKSVTATAPAGTVAKAVRLRATSGQKTAIAVRDFSFTSPDDTPAQVTGGPAAAPGSSASSVLDGNPDTAYRAAAAPTAGDTPLTVELGAARPMDRVTVLTDPTVRATASVEVRRAGGVWAPIGTVQPGYNELPAGDRPADAIRLTWAPGGQPPVVNQIVPWYADTPAGQLSFASSTLDVVTGQATPAQTLAVVASGRPDSVTGQLRTDVPAVAKGLTVTPAAALTVPRGGQATAPLLVTATADTPSGTYQVPVTFTADSLTVRQVLQVHVVPPTSGPDLAPTAVASSSGDETPAFPASNVNDGDPKTRWSSPAVDNAWVQLRLPQPVRLGSVVLHWQDAYAAAYQVQTSADGVNWTTVAAVGDGKGGTETVRFDAPGTQYLRIQGVSRATRYGYSLWGIEAYAVTPAPATPTTPPVAPVNPPIPPVAPIPPVLPVPPVTPPTPTPTPTPSGSPAPTPTAGQ